MELIQWLPITHNTIILTSRYQGEEQNTLQPWHSFSGFLGLNIRGQIMWNPSTNPYLMMKLHRRILSVCLSSTGALIQDFCINDSYLQCRRCGFLFPCKKLDKNQNCETIKSFDISRSKLILPTSNNNKNP